jgi:hypothetical protein
MSRKKHYKICKDIVKMRAKLNKMDKLRQKQSVFAVPARQFGLSQWNPSSSAR